MNTLNVLKLIAALLGTCTILVSFSLLDVPPSSQPTDVIIKGLSDFLTIDCYASEVFLNKLKGGRKPVSRPNMKKTLPEFLIDVAYLANCLFLSRPVMHFV